MMLLPKNKAMKIKLRMIKEGQENLKKEMDKAYREYKQSQQEDPDW